MKFSFPEYHLFQLLRRFDNQYLPLDLFLRHYFRAHKALGANDRRIISEAVYGMTRWRLLLDHLIGTSTTWERRYAIFSQFQPTQYLSVNSIPLHVRVSSPKELFDLLVKDYGEERASYLAQVCNTAAPTTVRINPLKTTRESMLFKWAQEHDVTACEKSAHGINFKMRIPLLAMPEYRGGLFEIQDEASQLVSEMVAVGPDDQVLDYCAGSGGKTLAYAYKMEGGGQVYLHDIRPFILEQAKKRLRRAGIQNVQYLGSDLSSLKKKMDWVLVDAPCSGTGTLRRSPDQKWRFSLDTLQRHIKLQREIFEKSLSYVKPGGKIVYATCSLLKDENERQLDYFLKTYPVEMVGSPFCSHPSFGGMDGFFAVTLQKRTSN